MILLWLIVILLGAGVIAAVVARWNTTAARWISLIALGVDFVIGLQLWIRSAGQVSISPSNVWIEQIDWAWIPALWSKSACNRSARMDR